MAAQGDVALIERWGSGEGDRGSTVEVTWELNVDAKCAVGYRSCVARAPSIK